MKKFIGASSLILSILASFKSHSLTRAEDVDAFHINIKNQTNNTYNNLMIALKGDKDSTSDFFSENLPPNSGNVALGLGFEDPQPTDIYFTATLTPAGGQPIPCANWFYEDHTVNIPFWNGTQVVDTVQLSIIDQSGVKCKFEATYKNATAKKVK